MRIGVDFDNTLVDYTGIFYKAGIAKGWIPASVGHSKHEVKTHFIDNNNEKKWTELQGIVYGDTIKEARPYEGAIDKLLEWKSAGHSLFLVSHKTKYPIIGDKLDFHEAARNWLKSYEFYHLFDELHFCEQKQLKVETIAHLKLAAFVDDLPDILMHEAFPDATKKVLFGGDANTNLDLNQVFHWSSINL